MICKIIRDQETKIKKGPVMRALFSVVIPAQAGIHTECV
ncbi:hypothetical protein MICA_1668 [Micavibrio aeruginosavorus ARL-13]|uniref:Uncharacterized protein n=1 Tax=Micavibrio aeruginosavorus (strain ARL-13) TaxID=856793 RepID=G2KQQ3_MICAA|nr:hypothetical protein MICA_1668 [Micavibrio aeruginosavorus ARL-13]